MGEEHDYPWVDLSPYWDELRAVSERRHRQKKKFHSTRIWTENDNTHLYGLCGEKVVSIEAGIPMDYALKLEGDGGIDFAVDECTYNVKTSTYMRSPDLKEICKAERYADVYILVVLDMKQQCGAIVGWATKNQLRRSKTRDYGYGLRFSISHTVLKKWHQTGLPPGLIDDPSRLF